jgi:hypothetical protein
MFDQVSSVPFSAKLCHINSFAARFIPGAISARLAAWSKKGRHAESFFDRHAGLVWESVTSNSREAGGVDVPFAPKLQAFECLEHHHELVLQSQAQRPHLLGHCRGAQLRRSPCRLRLLGQHSACVGVKRWKRTRDAHHRWSCDNMRAGAR